MNFSIPFFIIPLIAIIAYTIALVMAFKNKPTGVKSFARSGTLANLIGLALVFLIHARLPVGYAFEFFSETALIVGFIYAFFLPAAHKNINITSMCLCIAFTALSLTQGMAFFPDIYLNISLWFQATYQMHILTAGFLAFGMMCCGIIIFDKRAQNLPLLDSYIKTALLLAVAAYVLGLGLDMGWYFTTLGTLFLWNRIFMLKIILLLFLLLAYFSQTAWYKDLKGRVKFDALIMLLVFLVSFVEWGGVL